jgi:hypothetical protein
MSLDVQTGPVGKKMLWAGRILSALPIVMLLGSGVAKVLKLEPVLKEFGRFGYVEELVLPVGVVEIACTLIYLWPRTAVLGAILLTGYLGGATATHVRIGDPFVPPIIFGVVAWTGLYLCDPRLRALLPLRR